MQIVVLTQEAFFSSSTNRNIRSTEYRPNSTLAYIPVKIRYSDVAFKSVLS